MNKKNIAVGLLTASLLFTGCGANSSEVITDESKNIAISTVTEVTEKPEEVVRVNEENVETIGEIIGFSDNAVDILTGDIAEVFYVSNDQHKDFYLGQTVYVTKETDTEYSLMPYYTEDFSIRHTNMGHMILRMTGEVVSIDGETILVSTDEGEKSLQINEDIFVEVGKSYEFDVIFFNEDDLMVSGFYSADEKITVTIDGLERNDQGELIISGTSTDGMTYMIPTYAAAKNFNFTDLKVGATIDFYSRVMTMSIPAHVNPSRIDLLVERDLPLGTTAIEGESIGQVVEIDGDDVHVMSGDVIEIFTIGKDKLSNIHLGEAVKLFMKYDALNIEAYLLEDFSRPLTGWGAEISNATGKVVKHNKDENTLVVSIKGIKKTFSYYGDMMPQDDMTYDMDIYTMSKSIDPVVELYDPNSIINITIDTLNRADNGELMISGKDADGGEYVFGTSRPNKNFNLSQLKQGDVLAVYVDAIMESWPMQIDTRKIILVSER
ncbi:hypothetical protein EZV73_20680 [Acidaminobacter sp. JC074]|uniref:hypothetical protein n=1 Tax=Acidaminobacter sp. JC074 TaxID=2530199 RepID=UPI001F0F2C60|nr:hypothetical protein [Acidaminobacter sp. JC074]MCH4890007.1 hypothetical protein [Acidaminobacter sp. JC074]